MLRIVLAASAAALAAVIIARADSLPLQPIPALGQPTLYATVAALPTSAANGALVFAANCRAVSNAGGLNAALVTQTAGNGTGCLATFTTNGNVWQVVGTTVTVAQ